MSLLCFSRGATVGLKAAKRQATFVARENTAIERRVAASSVITSQLRSPRSGCNYYSQCEFINAILLRVKLRYRRLISKEMSYHVDY